MYMLSYDMYVHTCVFVVIFCVLLVLQLGNTLERESLMELPAVMYVVISLCTCAVCCVHACVCICVVAWLQTV